jgi:selenocysteine lyase/cysteine desulfurase
MTFNVESARAQFPALSQLHNDKLVSFLDGPGGSQVPQSVLDEMTRYLGHFNSNLGGKFFSSEITTSMMQQGREGAAQFLNAQSGNNIVFGPNMTSLTFSTQPSD